MNWNIKDNGDSIEKSAAIKLPSEIVTKYNSFWGVYIGCFSGSSAEIKDITEEQNRKRLLLGQYNYTLLFNLLVLRPNNSSFGNIKNKEYGKVVQAIQKYTGLIHTFYNTLEIIDKFNENFKTNPIDISKYKSFKAYRNVIAHNIRPFIKIDKTVKFISNYDAIENLKEHFVWSLDEPPHLEYQSIEEFKHYAFEATKGLLYKLIDQADKILKNELGNKSIMNYENTSKAITSKSIFNIPTSGSSYHA